MHVFICKSCDSFQLLRLVQKFYRRTIDLWPLNAAMYGQNHITKSPFDQALKIPPCTYWTGCDARNGYHSKQLDPNSQDKATFLTPLGGFRYLISCQSQNIGIKWHFWVLCFFKGSKMG